MNSDILANLLYSFSLLLFFVFCLLFFFNHIVSLALFCMSSIRDFPLSSSIKSSKREIGNLLFLTGSQLMVVKFLVATSYMEAFERN